ADGHLAHVESCAPHTRRRVRRLFFRHRYRPRAAARRQLGRAQAQYSGVVCAGGSLLLARARAWLTDHAPSQSIIEVRPGSSTRLTTLLLGPCLGVDAAVSSWR